MWAEIAIDSTMFWGFTSWDCWTSGDIRYNNGSANIPFTAGYPTTGLHHLVWVFQQGVSTSTLGKLYVDGVLYPSTGAVTPTLGTTNMRVSGWNNDAGYRWALNRFASHVAVYNAELTQAQVVENYNAAFAPTVSDNWGTTRSLISGAISKTVDTTGYSTEMGEPLSNGPSANTAWTTFVPATGGVWQIDTIGSGYDTALAVYTGSSLGSLTLVKADDSGGGSGNAKITLFLAAGATYYVQAGGAGGAGGGTLVLNVSLGTSILADDFLGGGLMPLGTLGSNAANPTPNTLTSNPDAETVIAGCDLTVTPGATVGITYDLQGSQNAGGQGKAVTWRIRRDNLAGAILVNSGSKNATVDSSAGNDTGMAYSGSYSDSSPTTGHYVLTSEGTGAAITTVFIGRSVFTVTGALPSTSTFTTETGGPLTMPVAKTGWVRFQPTIGGYYQFDTIGTGFDTGLAIYSGTVLTGLTLLGSDDNSGGSNTSKLIVHLDPGVIYLVQVGAAGDRGWDTHHGRHRPDRRSLAAPTTLVGAYGSLAVGLLKGRTTAAADALPGGEMAFIYSEFTTTPAGVVAAVKAAILTSSNYSNPTGQVVQCTAQNGATIALDLVGGGAADNQRMRTLAWRLFSGGVGTNSVNRTFYWNRIGNATTSTLRCRVAAGNTLLYIEIEGPRAGEANADSNTQGSYRQCIFISQITPYLGPHHPIGLFRRVRLVPRLRGCSVIPNSTVAYVSLNQFDSASWVNARLHTLQVPIQGTGTQMFNQRQLATTACTWLHGWSSRTPPGSAAGSLDMFFAGWNGSDDSYVNQNLADGMPLAYSGNTYKVTVPYRTDGTGSAHCYGSLGICNNASAPSRSPMIAVRSA